MNKKEIALLERAYTAEVEAALSKSRVHVMQTKAKTLADKLVSDGLLMAASVHTPGPWPCTVEGYELTEAGRLAYCMTC